MPLPTIANVYRVTFNHEATGHTAKNVLHFSAPSLDEQELGDAIDTALGGLAADSHLFWPLPTTWECDNLDIIKLDGNSATVNVPLTNAQQGGASGNPVYQASAVVTLHTTHRGPSGRGRVYVGPVAEDGMSNGVLDGTGAAVMQTAWTDFPILCLAELAVLSVASYVHTIARPALPATVRDYIGTQRRRARFLQG